MRAAAQFDGIGFVGVRILAHGQHAHFVAVFFAEQRFRARTRSPDRSASAACETSEFWRMTALTSCLDALEFVRRHGFGMAEIEAQPIGRDERTLLRHMRAEHALQRGMQKMRRRMVGARGAAALAIDLEIDRIADREFALGRSSTTCTCSAPSFFSVSIDTAFGAFGDFDRARDRRPGRRIRRRTASGWRGSERSRRPSRFSTRCAVLHDSDDRAFGFLGVVAQKFRVAEFVADREPQRSVAASPEPAQALRASARCLRHRGIEAVCIDGDAARASAHPASDRAESHTCRRA